MGTRIGSITFNGLASGFPTDEIIAQVLELERRPIDLLERQRDDFNVELGIFQDLNAKTQSLRDILEGLDNVVGTSGASIPTIDPEFRSFTAQTSDPTVATATATQSAFQTNLSITVDALASVERHTSVGYAAADTALDISSLSVTIGGNTTPIAITDATPQGVVNAVNEAGVGVSAYLLDTGDPAAPIRVVLESNTTGTDQDFSLSASIAGSGATFVILESQSAANAQITLDPLGSNPTTITSATNAFSGIGSGLSITALKVDSTPISIRFDTDADAITSKVANMFAAFNEIMDVINDQFVVDPATRRGGPLLGDSTLVSLKQRLTGVVSYLSEDSSASIRSASAIGISLDRNSKMTFDEEQFRAQLAADFDGVEAFVAGVGNFADRIRTVADRFVHVVDGALVARINGIGQSISDMNQTIEDAEERLETVEAGLVAQFAALERTISQLRQQGDFLSQFLLSSIR